MSPRRSTIVIAVMAVVIAGLFWALVYYARDEFQLGAQHPQDEIPVASAVTTGEGFAAVAISVASQRASGIVTAPLAASRSETTTDVYGVVVDLQPLIDLRARYIAAGARAREINAALRNSRAEFRRVRKLFDDERNVSERALQLAEAQLKGDQARLQAVEEDMAAVRDALRAAWGSTIAAWATEAASRNFEALAAQRELLTQMTFPFDLQGRAGSMPLSVSPVPAGTTWRPARYVSPSPRTDAALPGETFFYVVQGPGLRTGMRLTGRLRVGEQTRDGVLIPNDAVVWHGGRAWAYVQQNDVRFVRKPVMTSQELADGWFTADGFAPGDQIVVSGAQLLLSEELKFQIRNENED